ncbi:hypothetical protein DFH09DRAFT_1354959 [Mycena vulgaris]|nr:hypothetical protein DFH09DRAFT_1354959 [Mycena vulgaris]
MYQNISSLDIHRLTIDTAFRNTLMSLSKLENLTLRERIIVSREGFLSSASLTIMSRLGFPPSIGPLQLASPASLRNLTLNTSTERSPLMAGVGRGKLPHLVQIFIGAVHKGDVYGLFGFLERCPRLESLAITSFHSKSTLPVIHPHIMPLLRTLTGPPKLIQLLTPNHPDLMLAYMDISRSAIPLPSLALPCIVSTLEVLIALTGLFPELRELSITVLGHYSSSCGLGRRREDISDTESEEAPIVVHPNLFIAPVMTCSSNIDLDLQRPACAATNLRGSPAAGARNGQETASEDQGKAIAALSFMYSLLREVQLPFLDTWKRTGGFWKKQHVAQKKKMA